MERGPRLTRRLGALLLACLALAGAAAGDDAGWSIFRGQVNGPVKNPGPVDPAAFALKHYEGVTWTEGYYHHINAPDGSMITVSIGLNRAEANVAFVYDTPRLEAPFRDFVIIDFDEAKFDAMGFGYTIGQCRGKLEGSQYVMELNLPSTHAKIVYDLAGPSYTYGDGMVRYPDGDTFEFYNLPISYARVTVEAVLNGKPVKFSGFGNMNHDAGEIFPTNVPANWQVFWFFGNDHTLAVTDHFAREKFGNQLIQRLVFLDTAGNMFTSTSFDLKWSEWEKAKNAPFRYPQNYTLAAEGGGAKLTLTVTMDEILLIEDLFSNLPAYLRIVAKRLTKNGWTADSWSNYTLTYTYGGKTKVYQGRGVVRWTDLESSN